MKYLNTLAASKILNITKEHVIALIQKKRIKAEKVNPSKLTSAYLISEENLNIYKNNKLNETPSLKRCEPCLHPKKLCKSCRGHICLHDFSTQSSLLRTKRPSCKNCENKIRKNYRNKIKNKVINEI